MAKHFSTSQFKSQLNSQMRRIESQYRQTVNREMRKFTSDVNRAVSKCNSAIRQYNSSVRRNQQIASRELRKLQSYSTSNTSYTISLHAMQQHYSQIGAVYYEGVEVTLEQERILDLIEQEQANGIITANVIENNVMPEENTEDIEIGNKLALVSQDLLFRWQGAVFSLNPQNPDASRHFCTSTRELFTDFIELKAPDREVFAYNPNAEKTKQGNATRKEKIRYMMRHFNFQNCVVDFADSNIENILQLFFELSGGTHGKAGKYDMTKLLQVKKRVEQGINFLCEISA